VHRELFDTFTETGSDLCVELGMGAKHAVRGSGTISFRLESGEVLRVSNVLWVPELRRSVLSVSEIERKGYHVLFQDGQVLFVPRRSSFRSMVILGVREGKYRLRGQPMHVVTSRSKETDEEEQVGSTSGEVGGPTSSTGSKGVGISTSGEAGGPTSSTGSEGEGSSTSDEEGSPTSSVDQREPEFRGSQPSRSSREEKPPRIVQRRLDFRGGQQVQRE
jgi:hypothetical protein